MNKAFPLLGLIDALEHAEHMPIDRKLTHAMNSGKFWDKRTEHFRPYLQCVIFADWLREHGQATFESRQSASYYSMVLRRPGKVEAGLRGKQYQAMLADLDPSLVELPTICVTARAPQD